MIPQWLPMSLHAQAKLLEKIRTPVKNAGLTCYNPPFFILLQSHWPPFSFQTNHTCFFKVVCMLAISFDDSALPLRTPGHLLLPHLCLNITPLWSLLATLFKTAPSRYPLLSFPFIFQWTLYYTMQLYSSFMTCIQSLWTKSPVKVGNLLYSHLYFQHLVQRINISGIYIINYII